MLLEHQSRPDRWIRFRLLKYCCRIWDRSRVQFPRERRLRPIVPLVFYQGPGHWRHATEFAELFADSVRGLLPWSYRPAHADRSVPASTAGDCSRAVHLLAELLPQADRDARPYVAGVPVGDRKNPDTARRFDDELRVAVSGTIESNLLT